MMELALFGGLPGMAALMRRVQRKIPHWPSLAPSTTVLIMMKAQLCSKAESLVPATAKPILAAAASPTDPNDVLRSFTESSPGRNRIAGLTSSYRRRSIKPWHGRRFRAEGFPCHPCQEKRNTWETMRQNSL
jgi:hypothetical protein